VRTVYSYAAGGRGARCEDPTGAEGVRMSFAVLALISAAAVLGPLLALPRRWHLPVVLGELGAGIALGPTGVGVLPATDRTFTFLADVGFALVMFVAGSRVPVRDAGLRTAIRPAVLRVAGVGVLSVVLAVAVARLFGTGHPALYAVLMASSSAALALPVIDSLRLAGPPVLQLLPQIAIADAACIVALPLAVDPGHAGRAALGALAVVASSAVLFAVLWRLERSGLRKRAHRVSEERKFALELRVHLVILFALAALAVRTHVSIMLAGFCFGLAVAGVGEPRRLARQLFAVTEGFLGPLFFVWLGASLDLGDLARHPSYLGLGLALGLGALATHLAMRVTGQPLALGGLASAQLGVPVAAATIGSQAHLLRPGEAAALLLGALVTVAAAVLCGGLAVRAGLVADADRTAGH
jgi:Kef-type K+ transport system membrane component KefB